MARRPSAALVVLLLAGCNGVPWLRVPQVEQATEATHDAGERYRTHLACSDGVKSVDDLIGCMHAKGWDFMARGPGYPESDCWQARDRGELERLAPLCFVRSPEHETVTAPGASPATR
jgi:hypothetical protein